MHIGTRITDAISKYLDLTSDQMKLTAGNMANVDTPGYKTQGFDFSKSLSDAMNFGPVDDGGYASSGAHVHASEVSGLISRPDGNNVSMDREGLELAKAQLQFRTGVELLKHQFSRTMSAIHADGK